MVTNDHDNFKQKGSLLRADLWSKELWQNFVWKNPSEPPDRSVNPPYYLFLFSIRTIKYGRARNSHGQVAFLETDVGQCEFTPSGLVSLNIVSEAVYGPPFMHLQTPVRSHYFGAASSKGDASHYLEVVGELLRYYSQELAPGHIPLIINTQGWVKGLGSEILRSVVELANPNNVVELLSSSFSKNLQFDWNWKVRESLGFFGGDFLWGQYDREIEIPDELEVNEEIAGDDEQTGQQEPDQGVEEEDEEEPDDDSDENNESDSESENEEEKGGAGKEAPTSSGQHKPKRTASEKRAARLAHRKLSKFPLAVTTSLGENTTRNITASSFSQLMTFPTPPFQ